MLHWFRSIRCSESKVKQDNSVEAQLSTGAMVLVAEFELDPTSNRKTKTDLSKFKNLILFTGTIRRQGNEKLSIRVFFRRAPSADRCLSVSCTVRLKQKQILDFPNKENDDDWKSSQFIEEIWRSIFVLHGWWKSSAVLLFAYQWFSFVVKTKKRSSTGKKGRNIVTAFRAN